jgi:hypothetical protein
VAAQLTHDRGHGEGGEGGAVLGIEALDGLEHTELRDLNQVIERFASPFESSRTAQGDPPMVLHQLVAGDAIPAVPILAEALEDRVVVGRHVSVVFAG